MHRCQGKRYWLIGASEGLGRALAHEMSAAGAELFLSARSTGRLNSLVAELPGKAYAYPVDVTDRMAVKAIKEQIGDLDGLVYLAGVYWPMRAQEWNSELVELMGQINFSGGLNAVGAVISDMIDHDDGHIILTGSLSGFRGLSGAVGYGASKAGLMYFAEGLHADLRKTGVHVQLVNPGFIKTRLTDKNNFPMPFIMTPEAAAKQMFLHMNSNRFKVSFPKMFSWVFRFSQFLPDWLYYRIF